MSTDIGQCCKLAVSNDKMGYLVPDEYLLWLDYLDLQTAANIFITFTPLFSYGASCYGIWRKGSSLGFSIDICATMLMALILRIMYYLNTPYEVSLLRQLIVMVFIQCLLLKTALKYRPASYRTETLEPLPSLRSEIENCIHIYAPDPSIFRLGNLSDEGFTNWSKKVGVELYALAKIYVVLFFLYAIKLFDVHYRRPKLFWQWANEIEYWKFVIRFASIFGFMTLVFKDNNAYGAFIGSLGLFIEALLPLPQILMLDRLRSVTNFKLILLLSWLGGDLTKISYLVFGASNISIIFIIAALFQMSLDIYIAFQYIYYRNQEKDADFESVIEMT